MSTTKTQNSLIQAIEKLRKISDEMKSYNEDNSNEFIMLIEVTAQCVLYLQIITNICEKSSAHIIRNLSDITEFDRQANEYVQLVEILFRE